MIQSFLYAGHSAVIDRAGGGRTLHLAPNLAREPVAFDAELRDPVRFREAISALHDVVIADLRFQKRDKTSYAEWKKNAAARAGAIRRKAATQAHREIAARRDLPIDGSFQRDFEAARKRYWTVRLKYSDYLRVHDPSLWRKLLPCDPVITVADDVVFFECFSKDESAYGCLSVDRERGFGPSSSLQLGTTNVDYSPALYEQFQTLRTYRPTRFNLTPEGATVHSADVEHREEKIDLPTSWLRGFMKLQAAMTMPTIRVGLTRDVVYSLLAFLKRNVARTSPRALRFELEPGRPARLVLEPWEKSFDVHGPNYDGPPTPPIRIWGTRRLLVLARTLPLVESIDVYLLASGLPSFWVARMNDMTFTLGLSGWTTNDWSAGSALDMLQPPRAPSPGLIDRVAVAMRQRRVADLATIAADVGEPDDAPLVGAALRHLAQSGQVIFDLPAGRFRYRQIMSQPLGEAQLGPEDAEVAAARHLVAERRFELIDRQDGPRRTRVIVGKAEAKPVEILVDDDDRILRGKCLCGHYQKFGLRNGPCRHMIALRWGVSRHGREAFEQSGALNERLGRT